LYPFPERAVALDAAVRLFEHQPTAPAPDTVTGYATTFLGWLSGARLVITADPVTYTQGNPAISQATSFRGGRVQLTDTQQVTLTVEARDSKGFDTSDTLTWTSSDDTVVSLQPSADTLSCLCVAGNPGLGCVITVTDGTISGTDSIDVTPGGVASLVISEGTPEEQPPAGP
jgi:hypothetical protein